MGVNYLASLFTGQRVFADNYARTLIDVGAITRSLKKEYEHLAQKKEMDWDAHFNNVTALVRASGVGGAFSRSPSASFPVTARFPSQPPPRPTSPAPPKTCSPHFSALRKKTAKRSTSANLAKTKKKVNTFIPDSYKATLKIEAKAKPFLRTFLTIQEKLFREPPE